MKIEAGLGHGKLGKGCTTKKWKGTAKYGNGERKKNELTDGKGIVEKE